MNFKDLNSGYKITRIDKKIAAIIPSFNEEKTIVNVIKETKKYVDIIISVDSSTDNTPKLIEQQFPDVLLIKEKKGKGRQIRKGIKEVKKFNIDYVVFIDSDGERDPNDIPKLIEKIELNNVDMIIGTRDEMRSWNRNFLNKFVAFWVNNVTGFKLKDALSGFIVIKKESIKKLKLSSSNFEIETEIILEAMRNNLKIIEADVSVPKISKSKCTFEYMLQINSFFDEWVLKWVKNEPHRLNFGKRLFLSFFCLIGLFLTKCYYCLKEVTL